METETIESKKCNNCLKRVSIEKLRCSYCGKDEFTYDGAVIVQEKPSNFNLIATFAALFKIM